MRFKLLYVISVLILLAGCGTEPNYERNNKNDPKSGNFEPNPPTNQSRSITEDKEVILTWQDQTDYEQGYLVEKKLYEDGDYVTLDTLAADTESYTDDSKMLTPDTMYRISSFVYDEESPSGIRLDDPQFISIDLRTLGGIKAYDADNFIKINWDHALDYFDVLRFGYRDLTNAPNDTIFTDSLFISQLSLEEINASKNFRIDTPKDGFTYEVVMQAVLHTPNGNSIVFSNETDSIKVNTPSITALEFLDEETLQVKWESGVPDIDEFEINDGDSISATVNGFTTQFAIKRPFRNRWSLAKVKAIKNKDTSKVAGESIRLYLQRLNFFEVHPKENSVKLSWKIPHNQQQPYTRFIVERAINSPENFEPYQELPPDATEFIDSDISRENEYYYRVRSASSNPTEYNGIRYSVDLMVNDQLPGTGENQLGRTPVSSEIRKEITLLSGYPDFTVTFTERNGTSQQYIDPEFNFFSAKYSPDGNLIMLTGDPSQETISNGTSFSKIFAREGMTELASIKRNNITTEKVLFVLGKNSIIMNQFYNIKSSPPYEYKTDLELMNVKTNQITKIDEKLDGIYEGIIVDNSKARLYALNMRNGHVIVYDLNTLVSINSFVIHQLKDAGLPKLDEDLQLLSFVSGNMFFEYDLNTNVISNSIAAPTSLHDFNQIREKELILFAGSDNGLLIYDKESNSFSIPLGGKSSDLVDYWQSSDEIVISNFEDGIEFAMTVMNWTIIPPKRN